jgi:hypothetical protein
MKRSFRVATVFTGAAACAVARVPAAQAAPAAGATAKITPQGITANDCTAGEWNWAHMTYTAAERHPVSACFGGTGVFKIPGNKRFTYFCPGDNSGYIQPKSHGRVSFVASENQIPLFSEIISTVSIIQHFGGHGSSRC